ncbi:hypothetical protein Bca101_091224 [Brassica carinata]
MSIALTRSEYFLGRELCMRSVGAHNNLERRPWLRQEYPTPQPCTAMAPNKEPWGKAAQATRHHIRVGKRAAGIHQGHSAMQKEVLNMGFASLC